MSQTVSDPKQDEWLRAALGLDPASYPRTPGADPDAAPGDATMDRAAAAGTPAAAADPAALAAFEKAVEARKWPEAATGLEALDEAERRHQVAKLKPAVKKRIHAAAIKRLGVNAKAAQATAALDPPVLGGGQAKRAQALTKALSPADRKAFDEVLKAAKTPVEKSYISKGLAAGHSVAELKAFGAKIAGKNAKWLQDNLSLTGDSSGKGVKQQWSMSCNATAAEAVKGEMDPLYALKMHEDNPKLTQADNADGAGLNPNMAAEQKAWLESNNPDGSAGGQARDRGDRTAARGRWNTDLLNNQKGSTGLDYTRRMLTDDKSKAKGIKDMNAALDKKMPVPIVVGDGGAHAHAHYVVITASDPGPPRYYSIHDPATGDTVVRSEEQLKGGNLGVSWNKISAIELPTAVPIKGKKVK